MKKLMTDKNRQDIRSIVFAAICLAFVLYVANLWQGFQYLLGVFSPILIGAGLAFVFNVPMKKIEGKLKQWKVSKGLLRSLAISLVLLLFLFIVTGVVAIIVPTLAVSVSRLGHTIQTVIPQIGSWLASTGLLNSEQLTDISSYLTDSGLINKGAQFLTNLTGNLSGILGNVFTVMMALFLMFAMLGSKEHLASITNRILDVTLPKKVGDRLRYVGSVMVETYDGFLMGQLIEAFIIGFLVFGAYSLAGLPYASMTGVLAGVLSFIPYIGPFAACGLGAVFIFTISPWQALLSIVVFQLVQLVEGNLIYPRVVGSQVGLPSLFTLAAALVGGNLFGLVGMIFFTPIFAVIYRLVKEMVEEKERLLTEKEGEG
ncbi:AI-2E family transporter [Streptococcus sp. NLN64]|uniref:AI-2E family transporter n=1 Tax=Streptococcus sp. NLN64 TaxID=2822799 RepID=UPI001FFD4277|nr:AI-2E family transporter [Streptococcus sp. NLN64]